jgi:glycosyltransferase involved in cell wall biosynthesis
MFAFNLLKTSISKHVDVIHVVTGTSTMVGAFAIVMGRTMGLPSVISFFGKEQFEFATPVHRWLFKITISLATSIGVNTPYTGASIPSKFQHKVHLLLGGAEEWKYRPSSQNQQDRRILFVGRLVNTKGVDDLIKALQIIQQKRSGVRLVLVGDGPERTNLVQLAAALGVNSRVEFTGTLTGPSLQNEYEKSDVVVLPSKYIKGEASSETLGLTLIEASMHSKPLVGTSHGGIPEIVKDGQNGFLVPADNPQALADALVRLLSDDRLRQLMGAEALRIARTKFTWDAATERLLQTYTK